MTTRDEQETTLTWAVTDEVVRIFTAVPKHINRLRKDDRATLVKDYGDSAMFTVPASEFDPLKGFKRRRKPLTPEQRTALADRLKKSIGR